MEERRKIEPVIRKVSFAEAEDIEIEYYASIDWKESASVVEEMRKQIWNKEYKKKPVKIIRKSSLKEDRDDFE